MTATTVETVAKKPWTERMAVIALFVANGFGVGTWATTIPVLKARFALTDGSLSLILFAFTLGGVIAMPLSGVIGQRFGSAWSCKAMAIWFVVALALPTLAPSFVLLAVACFALGSANAGLDVAMNVQASDVERRWGSAIMSFFHACWSLGALAGASFGALVFSLGIEPNWILWSAAFAAAVLTVLAFGALINGPMSKSGPMLTLPGWAAVPLCLCVLLAMLTEHAVIDWSGVYLRVRVLETAADAATGYVFFAGAMLAARIFGDGIVSRLGKATVLRLGGALATAGLLLVALVPMQLPCLIGFTMAGIGLANVVPSLFSAASRIGPSASAGIAMAATAGYTGFLSGPAVIGAIATTIGLEGAMLFMASCALAIAMLSGRLTVSEPGKA